MEIISLFTHSLLTIKKIFWNERHWQCKKKKKVHKNKLMIELSIQMSSLLGYLQAQDSTVMFGYTLSTTFLFSSKNKMLSEDIFSGTQQGSGIPGTTPTALTILWMVAWFDGFKDWKRKERTPVRWNCFSALQPSSLKCIYYESVSTAYKSPGVVTHSTQPPISPSPKRWFVIY